MGYPTKPTHYAYDIPYEQAKDLAGWWEIETEDTLPFADNLSNVWTTPDIRFFHDHGIQFRIKFGAWDANPLPEIHIPDDKTTYCIFSGLLTRERTHKESRWLDDHGLIRREDGHGRDRVFLQRLKCPYWRSGRNLSGYLYAYARTQIWEQAIRHNALAITVDAIITREPVDIPGTAHDGKRLWSTSPYTGVYDHYVAPSPNYCGGLTDRTRNDWPIKYPEPIEGLEHTIGFDGDYLLTGAGGTGKSHAVYKSLGWLGPTYVAPRLDLLADKEVEGWIETVTEKSFPVDDGFQGKGYLRRDIPKVVFMDEIGLMSGKDFDCCLEKCQEYGIRVIMAGDEAQIKGMYTPEEIWDRAREYADHCLEFKIDRRSRDAKIRRIKAEIRELALTDMPEDRAVRAMRLLLLQMKRPNKSHRAKLPHIKLYRHDPEKHGPLPEGGSRTIDKVQGMTIREPTICVINGNSRRDHLARLIYTMVSRFVSNEDLYIWDTTGFSKSMNN